MSMFCRRFLTENRFLIRLFTRRLSTNSVTASTGGLSSICNKIKAGGPITVAEYMKECLLNPIWGYYATRDNIIGSRGDFITSPEISQIFGELIGVWVIADLLVQKGKGSHCRLVELGPGTGSLSKDILRVFDQLKGHCGSLELHLVEASSKMAAIQYSTLTGNSVAMDTVLPSSPVILDNGVTVTWYNRLSDVPKEFAYYIAHEFFDALPIHQFKLSMHTQSWKEILVDIENNEGRKLRFIESPTATPATISYSKFIPENCTVGEVSPETMVIIDQLADRVATSNGAALIADYGGTSNSNKFTLRGFRNHKESNILEDPGLTDLTADVNFDAIKKVVKEKGVAMCHGAITQNEFLHKMGIRERIDALVKANSTNESVVENLMKSYEMLSSPKQMGERFKFMSITGKHRHAPTPF